MVDLNLNGTWNVTGRVGKHMVGRGFGAIVSIVHLFVRSGAPPFVHSSAAHGVVNMTRSRAYYWARKGVTINSLAPGTTLRPVCARKSSRTRYQNFGGSHQGCSGTPAQETSEVAGICAFLCSPAARSSTARRSSPAAATTWLDPDARPLV
jgi:NAD(P)-dependent dehydrogenase (short-subunit alcohol dehydrogenase family)